MDVSSVLGNSGNWGLTRGSLGDAEGCGTRRTSLFLPVPCLRFRWRSGGDASVPGASCVSYNLAVPGTWPPDFGSRIPRPILLLAGWEGRCGYLGFDIERRCRPTFIEIL
jgi:hypothetical protein